MKLPGYVWALIAKNKPKPLTLREKYEFLWLDLAGFHHHRVMLRNLRQKHNQAIRSQSPIANAINSESPSQGDHLISSHHSLDNGSGLAKICASKKLNRLIKIGLVALVANSLFLAGRPDPTSALPVQSATSRSLIHEQGDRRISTVLHDHAGRLWVGTWRGLVQVDPHSGQVVSVINLPNEIITAMTLDHYGNIWVGTGAGLYQVNPSSRQIKNVAIKLPSNRVLSLEIDRAGYVWVGTENGITRIGPHNAEIYARMLDIPGTSANTMQIDHHGHIWVGTLDGIFKFNPGTAEIMAVVPYVAGQIVQSMTIDPAGKIWAGTPRNVILVNPNTNEAIARINDVTGEDILALASDKNGELWIGTQNRLHRTNTYNGKIDGSIQDLPSSRISSLYISDRKLWIGTHAGLARIDINVEEFDMENNRASLVYAVAD